jgi:hypothetical protein
MTVADQVRHAFPAYKVFIYGVDVTEDVLQAEVRWNHGRAPNSCDITLANDLDKFIFTTKDLKTVFIGDEAIVKAARRPIKLESSVDGLYARRVDFEQAIEDVVLELAETINPELKRNVIINKLKVRKDGGAAVEVNGKESSLNPLKGDIFRYPLQAEDPIFHPNDHMRVFFRDPFKPSRWYHMFAGFVADFDDNVDENNQKILTITGEGPSRILRYGRITTNPGIIDIDVLQDAERDAVFRSTWAGGFAGLTLPEFMFSMIFGNDPNEEFEGRFKIERQDEQGRTVIDASFRGIGNFNFERSAIIEFGPKSETEDAFRGINFQTVEDLATYQSIIDHEVKITDLEEMAVPGATGVPTASEVRKLPDGSYDPTHIIELIGSNPSIYPVDGGRLILFMPASFHPEANREVLLRDVVRNFRMNTEFSSRLGMIYDTIDRIEFVFYESPKGDLICEFPLYDFDPDDWEFEEKERKRIENSKLTSVNDDSRGPFAQRYIVTKKDTYNFSRQFTDEKVRTQVIGHWQLAQNWTEDVPTSKDIQDGAVITLKHLVPLYGLRLEQVNPKGYIATKEAAYTYAHITLNKMNADARNLGINAVANFGLWLNRPVFFAPRNCIGTTTSLAHTIKWGMGGSVDTRINLNYIRGWDGLVDASQLDDEGNPKPAYTPIGGQPSRPLDYKVLFKLKNPDSGNNPNKVQET